MTHGTFPFGCPVTPCHPSAQGPRPVFVLGAYPSALHVRWRPPTESGFRAINALAVANEPEPFWNGKDQRVRIDEWKAGRGWQDDWGEVEPVAHLNGSSGRWVDDQILMPLRAGRDDAWITDCLDTYRASTRMTAAIASVYEAFASASSLPTAELAPHPSEGAIVREARADHLPRLRSELTIASPHTVITLGNAALRVLRHLLGSKTPATKLTIPGYGQPIEVNQEGFVFTWLPLAHPAAPTPYQDAHSSWLRARA